LHFVLREYFKEGFALEGSLELLKRDLAVRPDFTVQGVFNLFAGYSSSRLSTNDLLYGMERMGVVLDIADAKLILERYDSDVDGRLGFWEFSNMVLPIEPIMRDELERRK